MNMPSRLFISLALLLVTSYPCTTAHAEEHFPTKIVDGRNLSKRLREYREKKLVELQQHQSAVRELEALGYEMLYEVDSAVVPEENISFNFSTSAYVRNSLAERVVVPVVAIRQPCYKGFSEWYEVTRFHDLKPEMLLPLTRLRRIDLSESGFTLSELEQLQQLPNLKVLVLNDEQLTPEMREKIQTMFLHCVLLSEEEAWPNNW